MADWRIGDLCTTAERHGVYLVTQVFEGALGIGSLRSPVETQQTLPNWVLLRPTREQLEKALAENDWELEQATKGHGLAKERLEAAIRGLPN